MSEPLPPQDRARLETLFEHAADLAPTERAAFVARECGTNAPLSAELLRLLAAQDAQDVIGQLKPSPQLRPGTRVGGYEIRERIGEGGMGEVYAAQQHEPVVRRVALKVVKLGLDSAQVVARFEAERQALARMAHPNVAQVFDAGVTASGRPYFVMELVDGEPITAYCDRRRLTTRQRLEVFLQVCAGVQHAHVKGIVHRDLKPSNLLVGEQDGRPVAKVIDFGIARATSGRLTEHTLQTSVGQLVGTLDYMSPEQADVTALDVDTRSDVYSLGVVLYELTSGLLPFELSSPAGTPLSEVQRILRERNPPTPSQRLRREPGTATAIAARRGTDDRALIRQLTGDLDWICLKALEKDPGQRYQSAAELAADVRRHLAHEPTVAGRPSVVHRARKFIRRHRTGVAAGGLMVVSALAGVFGIVQGRVEAEAKVEVVLGLSDIVKLGQLVARGGGLWPPVADRVDAFENWLREARELASHLGRHRANLAALRAGGPAETEGDRWLENQLTDLVDGLAELDARLRARSSDGEGGWSIERRLAEARRLAAGFAPGGEYATAWKRDLPAIRAAYPEFPDLKVQDGLLPLDADPVTGLWEFAHLLSGTPAERGTDRRIAMQPDTGIILVLLHGGSFTMGAQDTDKDRPNFDPHSGTDHEGPPTMTEVEPFFISKFEMTRAQWERLAGMDPAMAEAPCLPVTQVDWAHCDETMSRLGLALPTEAEWEYAARAGTTDPWWTGPDLDTARGAANLKGKHGSDQFAAVTEVGRLPPNPFGLHDVMGNVSEWCANHPWRYGTRPGSDVETLKIQVCRGGNARSDVALGEFMKNGFCSARLTQRHTAAAAMSHPMLGLRPARAVER